MTPLALISGFCCTKRPRVFLLPLDGMLVHRRVTLSIKFVSTHLYTWVERGTVRVVLPKNSTLSPVRDRTRTALSGDERTNHEATAPQFVFYDMKLSNCPLSLICLAIMSKFLQLITCLPKLTNWRQSFMRLSCYWSWISLCHCQSSRGSTRW